MTARNVDDLVQLIRKELRNTKVVRTPFTDPGDLHGHRHFETAMAASRQTYGETPIDIDLAIKAQPTHLTTALTKAAQARRFR